MPSSTSSTRCRPRGVAEAVRSLAARQLLVALPGTDRLQVRGDLGIAVVFQQRARSVIDAGVTGTEPGEPWRTLLLPQPEGVALEVLIDAIGVHELSLREVDEALRRLRERLPAVTRSVTPATRTRCSGPRTECAGDGHPVLRIGQCRDRGHEC